MHSAYASRPFFRKSDTHLISLDTTPTSYLQLPTIGITGRRMKLRDSSKLAPLNVSLDYVRLPIVMEFPLCYLKRI